MPQIALPVDAISEVTARRNARCKVFRMQNGKLRTITKAGLLAHYRQQDGSLADIELEPEIDDATGERVANKLPYQFRLHPLGIGFDYRSRTTGALVRVALTQVGGVAFDRSITYLATITGPKNNRIKFWNVATDLDIVIEITAESMRTFRVLKSENAPRSFRWAIEYEPDGEVHISSEIRGHDNHDEQPREGGLKRRLRLSLNDTNPQLQASGRMRFVRTESWNGQTLKFDVENRIPAWQDDAIYPVVIDPDITENTSSTGDDGYEDSGNAWNGTYHTIYLGDGNNFRGAWRFQTLAVDQGSDIDLAVLKLNVVGNIGGYSSGTFWGADIDDSSAWGSSNKPSTQTKTTASAVFARPTGNGIHSIDMTSILQEQVDRPGFANGNDVSYFCDSGEAGRYTKFEDFDNVGSNPATFEVDWTAGGGGGVGAVPLRGRTISPGKIFGGSALVC